MATKSRKVILFIVEGPTDEDALSPVLKSIFSNDNVVFHIVHGDITTDKKVDENSIVKEVHEHIKYEMDKYGYRPSDIVNIYHLIDTDGAFIPDDKVVYGDVEEIEYYDDKIICSNIGKIRDRNRKKKTAIMRLSGKHKIAQMPYSILFFSRNMEHVLHNRGDNLTEEEKIELADKFADRYARDPEGFISFMKDAEFAVKGTYRETWEFILDELNSLKRYSNVNLIFDDDLI